MPGKFRTTDFDPTTVNKILEDEFLRWTTVHRIPYSENNTFDANKKFTWNYKNFIDKHDKAMLSVDGVAFTIFTMTLIPHTRLGNVWLVVKPKLVGRKIWCSTLHSQATKFYGTTLKTVSRYTSTTEYTEVHP